jgi:hypothetical protein
MEQSGEFRFTREFMLHHIDAGNVDWLVGLVLSLAWMILALREGGIPADDTTVMMGLERLLALRDPAGHWPADEGAGNAVHVTLEALKSLQLCGYRI